MIPLTSATQITTHDECPRKWGWRYLARIEAPPHPSAELGTEVDEGQLQPYLRDGRTFDYTRESGYIAASILAHLPAPKTPGIEVQKHFVMPSPSGLFGYQGYIDLWLPPAVTAGTPCVTDFKTTSDLKWAKTADVLATDVQAQLYATWALWSTRAPDVDLVWLYMQTKHARKSRRVHLRVTADHAVEQFQAIDARARALFDVRKRSPASDHPDVEAFVLGELEPRPQMCGAYGGCPYRHKCNLSPAEILEAERVQELRRALPGIQTEGDAEMNTADLLANLKKRASAPVDAVAAAGMAAAAALPEAPPSINPPEAALPPPPVVEAAPGPATAKRGRPKKDPVGADVHAAIAPIETPAAVEGADAIKLARALRAACEAFLVAMGAT